MVTRLSSIAIQVHRMEPMVAFYTEAFGAEFKEVNASGFTSWFGNIAGIALKLVPLRDDVDFEGYPLHQLGFCVPDVEAAIRSALRHGGCQEGETIRRDEHLHAAIRDPDGNTLELYSEPASHTPAES